MFEKATGCLYGHILGDILGYYYRDTLSSKAKKEINSNLLNYFLQIKRCSPNISSYAQLSMALTRCLVRYRKYTKELVFNYYKDWYNIRHRYIDHPIYNGFKLYDNYSEYITKTHNRLVKNKTSSCLMICIPLGIFSNTIDIKYIKQYIDDNVSLTNPNKFSIDCVSIFILAIKDALSGLNKQEIYQNAISNSNTFEIRYIIESSMKRPQPCINDMYIYTDSNDKKYLGIALQNSFFELLHSNNFHDSMVGIISRGGETYINCSIAGGLLGAYYGINGIPDEWKDFIRNSEVDDSNCNPFIIINDLDKLARILYQPNRISIINGISCVGINSTNKDNKRKSLLIQNINSNNNNQKIETYQEYKDNKKKIDKTILKIKYIFNRENYKDIKYHPKFELPSLNTKTNKYLKISLHKLIENFKHNNI